MKKNAARLIPYDVRQSPMVTSNSVCRTTVSDGGSGSEDSCGCSRTLPDKAESREMTEEMDRWTEQAS